MNLFALNCSSSSGVRLLSVENRLSDVPLADATGVAPNPPLVCPDNPLPPDVTAASVPKPVPNPPPVLDERPNWEAEPNAEAVGGLLAFDAAKEKVDAEPDEEEPKPEGGCADAAEVLPKPPEDDGVSEDPNPPLGAAKVKLLAWTGAPKSLLPKPNVWDPDPPKPPEDP